MRNNFVNGVDIIDDTLLNSIGTEMNNKQPLDADLTAIAALPSVANKVPYATGAGTWALADLTAAGRALIDDATAAAQRATLGTSGATVINVKDAPYNAVGDGVANDSAAIQAAIDAAAVTGGTVFIPSATYRAEVFYKSSVNIKGGNGSGQGGGKGTVLKPLTNSGTVMSYAGGTVGLRSVTVSDLRIEGLGSGTGNGIRVQSAGSIDPNLYIVLRNVVVTSFPGGTGVELAGVILTILENVNVYQCAKGFYLNGSGGSAITSTTMTACYALECTNIGHHLEAVYYSTLNSTAADGCGTAYLLDSCRNVTLNSPGCEWGQTPGVSPADGFKITASRNILVSCADTYKNPHYSFWVTGSSAGVVFISPFEDTPNGATNSAVVDAGSSALFIGMDFTTAYSRLGTLTRIDSGAVDMNGSIVPTANAAYDLGSDTKYWNNLLAATAWLYALKLWGSSFSATVVANTAAAANQTLTLPAPTTDTLVSRTSTDTLTNKRITLRVGTVASSATPTINTDNVDQFNITALATAITSMTTGLSGTPTDGQPLDIRIKGDATPRTIAWGTSFTGTLLSTTAANKTHLQRLKYDAAAAKWAGYLADTTGY